MQGYFSFSFSFTFLQYVGVYILMRSIFVWTREYLFIQLQNSIYHFIFIYTYTYSRTAYTSSYLPSYRPNINYILTTCLNFHTKAHMSMSVQ